MFSRRRKAINHSIAVLAFSRVLHRVPDLTPFDVSILLAIQLIKTACNEFANNTEIKTITGLGLNSIKVSLIRLKDLNFVVSDIKDQHTLTTKGEYLIRGIEIKAARLIEDKKLSPWKRIKKGDSREKYLMPPTRKGERLY